MNRKVLVSGLSGFVGKNLLDALQGKFDIIGLVRAKNDQTAIMEGSLHWEDISDDSLKDIHAVIHLAGKAHDLKNTSAEDEYFSVNTNLTKKIFDHFLQSDVEIFIYMSSVKATADKVNGVLTEESFPDPKTPYGRSKMKAEKYILSQKASSDKKIYILRPCMIHGPGNKGNLNLLYKLVQKNIPYPLGAFANKRSFLSISNLNYVIEKLISDTDIAAGVYNVADDEPLSTNRVIEIMAQTINIKPKLWKINTSIIRSIAWVGDKLELPLNTERLEKLTESYIVSNAKLKKALKIKELPTTSAEGLRVTIQSFNSTPSK